MSLFHKELNCKSFSDHSLKYGRLIHASTMAIINDEGLHLLPMLFDSLDVGTMDELHDES